MMLFAITSPSTIAFFPSSDEACQLKTTNQSEKYLQGINGVPVPRANSLLGSFGAPGRHPHVQNLHWRGAGVLLVQLDKAISPNFPLQRTWRSLIVLS